MASIPLVLIVAAYFLLISGTMAETDVIREELLKAQKDVQVKEALERRLPEFEKKIAELDGQLAMIRRQLPEKKEIPDLLDQISSLGTQSGLQFQLFRPLPEAEKDFYAEVPVDLVVFGSFHNVVEFFDKVARMPRIVTITNIEIGKSGNKMKGTRLKGTPVEAKCKAVTFRFLETKIDTPAPAAAAVKASPPAAGGH
ncbi:MAG: type 4a pilus biogenesis protein PilO [Nitrospinae bacterium]|nr:type 4a pilus biogenesis protein PilO [Nitrospinota bacterium]